MTIMQAMELLSKKLLLILNKIEKIEENKDKLSKKELSMLNHFKEQIDIKISFFFIIYDNLTSYEKEFVREEINKTQIFCKDAKNKLEFFEEKISK